VPSQMRGGADSQEEKVPADGKPYPIMVVISDFVRKNRTQITQDLGARGLLQGKKKNRPAWLWNERGPTIAGRTRSVVAREGKVLGKNEGVAGRRKKR